MSSITRTVSLSLTFKFDFRFLYLWDCNFDFISNLMGFYFVSGLPSF
jgi:hypothetical protein